MYLFNCVYIYLYLYPALVAKIHAEWKQQQIKESLTRPQPRYALTTTANLAVGESLGGTHIDHVTEETTRNTAPSISDIFGHAILAVPGVAMHATGSSSPLHTHHQPALLSVPENRIRSGDGSLVSPAIVEEEDPAQIESETEIKLLQRRASASSPTDLGNANLLVKLG